MTTQPDASKIEDAPKTLMQALLAVQAEMPKLTKDATNPHFKSKYITLDALMEQVLPVLNRNGLVWLTFPEEGMADTPVLRYSLRLVANEADMLQGVMPLLIDKQNPQGLGSAITYARRQSLMAVLGLTAGEDDDANAASRPRPPKPSANREMVAHMAEVTRPQPTVKLERDEDRPLNEEEEALLMEAVEDQSKNGLADMDLLIASVGGDANEPITVAQGRAIMRRLKS